MNHTHDTSAPAPAEAATEIGAHPVERMGTLKPWERFAIRHAYPIAVVCLALWALSIWAAKP